MFACQQNLLHLNKLDKAVLVFICQQSNSLYNSALYEVRQRYFKSSQLTIDERGVERKRGGYLVGYSFLCQTLKSNKNYKSLFAQAAQQTLKSLVEALKSYKTLFKKFFKGGLHFYPSLPKYRKSGGLYTVSYPKQALKLVGGQIRVPLGKQMKTWFGLSEIYLPFPSNLDFSTIRELRILPRNGCLYAEYVYKTEAELVELNPNAVLAIDHGVTNLLTCVDTLGNNFIVDGKRLKSMNQWYNKRMAKLKKDKPQGFWSEKLASITERRNRQMRDGVNKAARIVVKHCLKNKIGKIVFGWNEGQKQECNLGRKNNQNFVQIPTARLKSLISQLCELHGIEFIEVTESYTSKASFLDGDKITEYGEKPSDWKSSGTRVKRGLYRTQAGYLVNADSNACANLLSKVSTMLNLNLDLSKVSRGCLTAPARVSLWLAKKIKKIDGVLTRQFLSV